MRRLRLKIAPYFAIVPTTLGILIGLTEPHHVSWAAWPRYYIFTTPSWFAVVGVIPLMAFAVKTMPGVTGWSPRSVSIFASILLLGGAGQFSHVGSDRGLRDRRSGLWGVMEAVTHQERFNPVSGCVLSFPVRLMPLIGTHADGQTRLSKLKGAMLDATSAGPHDMCSSIRAPPARKLLLGP